MYVCMYVFMYIGVYIRPSQPETPRLCNTPVFSAGTHDNKKLYLATIGRETAAYSTSLLHTVFRLLLTLPVAPARATRILVIHSVCAACLTVMLAGVQTSC